VPLIVQMFLWYFVAPELLPGEAGRWVKREMPLPEFTTAVVALGLFTAARVAVQVAAGLNSLSRGQRNAALALGMTETQAYRYVLLPNAARIMVPTLTTEFMSIVKNSAVALTIGLFELTASSRSIAEYTFQGFEAFTAATVIYIVLALSANALSGAIDRWTAIPRGDGAR
jgi:glutamate/aspartate transport system permease protein